MGTFTITISEKEETVVSTMIVFAKDNNLLLYRFTIDNKEIILYNVTYEAFDKSLIK